MSRVELAVPTAADEAEFLGRVAASRHLHHPWVDPPATPAAFAGYLDRIASPRHAGFLVRHPGGLVGVVNVNHIVRGALRSGFLGYYAFAGCEGRGLMGEGLALVLAEAFGPLGLHRLEANVQPANTASIRLVERAGFVREGYAERYLLVDGAWRDHERWALTVERLR